MGLEVALDRPTDCDADRGRDRRRKLPIRANTVIDGSCIDDGLGGTTDDMHLLVGLVDGLGPGLAPPLLCLRVTDVCLPEWNRRRHTSLRPEACRRNAPPRSLAAKLVHPGSGKSCQ